MTDFSIENRIAAEHQTVWIAGLDEAGRGALAGPVCAAAVILPLDPAQFPQALVGLTDSKLLSPKRREAYFDLITTHALAYGIGTVSAACIDEIGILPATKEAMMIALEQIKPKLPDYLMLDGRLKLKALDIPQESIIKGDSKSLSIAAASILAKVSRDKMMVQYAQKWPAYAFEQHKGYGTRYHRELITKNGGTPIHRKTFAPLKDQLAQQTDPTQ